MRDQDHKTIVAKVPNASFEPGKLYTMFVVGRTAGNPKVEAVTVEDQLIPPPDHRPEATPRP